MITICIFFAFARRARCERRSASERAIVRVKVHNIVGAFVCTGQWVKEGFCWNPTVCVYKALLGRNCRFYSSLFYFLLLLKAYAILSAFVYCKCRGFEWAATLRIVYCVSMEIYSCFQTLSGIEVFKHFFFHMAYSYSQLFTVLSRLLAAFKRSKCFTTNKRQRARKSESEMERQ